MKKKFWEKAIVMMLVVSLMLGLVGCGSEAKRGSNAAGESDYDKTVSFSITTWYSQAMAQAGYDLESEEYTQWVMDKFNVEIDAWSNPGGTASNTTRTWINAGTTPDCFVLPGRDITEFAYYYNLGMMKPLPENWEETWPNLAKMVEDSTYADEIKVDGRTICLPHAVFGNFNEFDILPAHISIYYRTDWAEQVGMGDMGKDGTISLSELKDFILKVQAQGLCDKPYFGGDISSIEELFKTAHGIGSSNDFVKTDSGYEWVYNTSGYEEIVKEMKAWYEDGVLSRDFYLASLDDVWEEFKSGLLPACYYYGSIGDYNDAITDIMKADGYESNNLEVRQECWDTYAMATVEGADGTVYSQEAYPFYQVHGFSPNCDDETMARILDMMDWFCTEEGAISVTCGIPGTHWEFDEEHNVVKLSEELKSGEYDPCPSRFFNVWGYAGDDAAYVAGAGRAYKEEQDMVLNLYDIKLDGTVIPMDYDYLLHDTEAKQDYSVSNRLGELIISSKNIRQDLNAFAEEYKTIWQPLLKELNELEK